MSTIPTSKRRWVSPAQQQHEARLMMDGRIAAIGNLKATIEMVELAEDEAARETLLALAADIEDEYPELAAALREAAQ